MSIDKKILNEINRYKSINKYIMEQDVPPPAEPILPPPPGDPAAGAPPTDPAAAGAPPTDPAAAGAPPVEETPPPAPVDTTTDPDVEKIGDEKEGKKELEITDLVKSQKNVEDKQEEYFNNLFKSLQDLEEKLSNMDMIVNKLNDIEAKVEKYRTKTPEEKLELRSLDSGPFNQKLSQYFEDKQGDFEKQGREEYILTKDEVEDFSPSEVKKSFRNFEEGRDDEPNAFNQFKF
jgi:hypothetical protein